MDMLNALTVLKSRICWEAGALSVAAGPALDFEFNTVYERNVAKTQDNREALNRFLASVEKRAYRIAEIATGNRDHALDIVQDAMMALVKNYSHKTEADWGPLFHRILQSKIRDWYRRSRTRNSVFSWLRAPKDDENDSDPIQHSWQSRSRPSKSCRCGSSRPFCCAHGKAWMSGKRRTPWAAARAASRLIIRAQQRHSNKRWGHTSHEQKSRFRQ